MLKKVHGRVGKKHSKETLLKMSLAKKGKKHTPAQITARKKCVSSPNYGMKGKKHRIESKLQMGETRRGKYIGDKNHRWKGDDVLYGSKHDWLRNNHGKASDYKCELCGKRAEHWSDKYHKGTRERKDYWTLCASCHMKWDYKHNQRKTRWGIKKFVN